MVSAFSFFALCEVNRQIDLGFDVTFEFIDTRR